MPPYASAGAQHSQSPANARIGNGDNVNMRRTDLKRESFGHMDRERHGSATLVEMRRYGAA